MPMIWDERRTWSTGKKENEDEDEDHAAVWQHKDPTLRETGVVTVAVNHPVSCLKHQNM